MVKLKICWNVVWLPAHEVNTCPFCYSTRLRRITSWRIWRSYLLGPWINPNWRQNLRISDYLGWSDITFDCNQKSFPNFVNGWTLSRWIRRRFVQKMLSIILMTCRHSFQCIMWGDFQLDRTHTLAKSSWDGCTIVQEVSLCACGHSFYESRKADINTNQAGPSQWRNSKDGYENASRGPTARRHSPSSCWKNEICASRSSSRRRCISYWQDDPSKIQQGRKSRKWLKV